MKTKAKEVEAENRPEMTDKDLDAYEESFGTVEIMRRLLEVTKPVYEPALPWDDRDELDHWDMIGEVHGALRAIDRSYDLERGPRITLEASVSPRDVPFGVETIVVVDFDTGEYDSVPPSLTLREDFSDSALTKAGYAYKRECGWDFSPGEAGVWVLCVYPTSAMGGDLTECVVSANLIGFAVLYDRDGDDELESLGHIWTAKAARRRGVATLLAQKAKELGARDCEYPWTESGTAFIEAVWRVRSESKD